MKMGDITVTSLTLVRDTLKDYVLTDATEDGAGTEQNFNITPTKGFDKMIIIIEVANSHGSVHAKLKAGSQYWASKDLSWDCPENKTTIMHVSDLARFKKAQDFSADPIADGIIVLELDPDASKQLTSDHAAKISVIEVP